ncbi:hypothetical protein [Fulvivirga lutea]|uniref:Uncharacterized protein n=1 Tax=Fulvivirga lutea TaxID=2810512 RepID=A0A974WII1_9BACT|nr:hypothetical protein [Fulvivirga lutea]QSE99178.1 hypothetical protein JR347_08845 [Fulvivirga lutea]
MKKTIVWIAIGATLLSFICRFIALNQTSFANGWDSYFYLVQVKSIFETGRMHSEEWTLFYPLLMFISLIFDYVIAVKIVSSLLAATLTLGLILLAYSKTNSIYLALFIATWSIASPELTYFAAQWPKNLLGLNLLVYMLLFLTKNQWKWALLFLILSFFGHRLTAVISLVAVVGWYVIPHLNVKVILISTLGLLLILAVLHFAPGLLSFYDIERLNALFGKDIILPPNEFISILGFEKVSIVWKSELWIYFAVIVISGFFILTKAFKRSSDKFDIIIWMLLLTLWFPIYNYSLDGAGYRFFHNGAILIPLLFIILQPAFCRLKYHYVITSLFSIILLGLSTITFHSYNPEIHDPPYRLFSLITQKIESHWCDNRPELIIAHKSLAEYFTFQTNADAMPWIPEYEVEKDQLFRIAYVPLNQLQKYYLKDNYLKLSSNYIYLKESEWRAFMRNIQKNESKEINELFNTWKNPHTIRPSFLLKN